jgi:prepilin-type processing-associated H-X9-DG protein
MPIRCSHQKNKGPFTAHSAVGFTIVELLVSIGIIAAVIAITIPVLGFARDSARRAQCLINARQIVSSINTFSGSRGGKLPENRSRVDNNEYVTWRHIFREEGYIEAQESWICPSHPDPGPGDETRIESDGPNCIGDVRSSYALNGHVFWRYRITDDDAKRSDTAITRPSHTILLAETNRYLADLRVSNPNIANYYGDNPGPYGYWHDKKAVYAFQDGHAEVLGLLETGSPDCRWHNGRDLSQDLYVKQTNDEIRAHDHPDWQYLVPEIYLP